ncbi:hypothetical protein [Paenibacillus puldeungensis]
MNPDPFQMVFLFCPLLAVVIGAVSAFLRRGKIIAPIIAFLFPLLYITTDWNTFKMNWDAWLLWGVLYAVIAFLTDRGISRIRKRNRK